MLDSNKWLQYGQDGLEATCITIHNTNNYGMSARELFTWLNEKNKSSQGCHYLVDHNEIIEVMPIIWCTYHTGKGYDYAFNHSIAIEICSNLNNDLYLKGEAKAVELIKELMEQYGFTTKDLYFHQDWNNKAYCPASILNIYGNKKNFIKHYFNEKKGIE